jgi:hypothetical protein
MERDQGGQLRSGTVEMLAVGPLAIVENAGVAWRSASARAMVIFSREWRQQAAVRDLSTRGYDYLAIGLVLRPANESVRRIRRPHRSISVIQIVAKSMRSNLLTLRNPNTSVFLL